MDRERAVRLERAITVTEAARNFADWVNRAHYQDPTFVLLKSGKPFARIAPDSEKTLYRNEGKGMSCGYLTPSSLRRA